MQFVHTGNTDAQLIKNQKKIIKTRLGEINPLFLGPFRAVSYTHLTLPTILRV